MAAVAWHRRSPDDLRRHQARLLDEWIRREVVPANPWWRERLRVLDGRDPTSFRRVPIAVERDVAGLGGPGNPALLLLPDESTFKRTASGRELWAAAREVRGGGSEGRRAVIFRRYKPVHVHEAGVDRFLAVAWTRTDLDRLHLAGARLVEVLGLGADDGLVNAVPAGPTLRFWGLYHAALAARITALHPRGTGQAPLAPVLRALQLLPATVLAVPTSEARALLLGLRQRGAPARNLRTVLAVGPPPTAAERIVIAGAAEELSGRPVAVQAVWGPDAGRVLYGEAPTAPGDPAEATYGLLTSPDLELLEVIDPATGRPVEPGAGGELVITSLGWRGTALIRFATGTWVDGLVEGVAHPATGSTVPRLAPGIVEAAWQPRVDVGGTGRRVDLRRAYPVLSPEALAPLRPRSWSLKEIDGRLVLGLDVGNADTARITALARRVAEAVGVVPEVRVGRKTAALRPQVGLAGPSSGASA